MENLDKNRIIELITERRKSRDLSLDDMGNILHVSGRTVRRTASLFSSQSTSGCSTMEKNDEDTERKMYWLVKNKLEENKYIHYEISNFARKGFESKHNTDCWKQKEYMAFGLAAHSYVNGVRYSNITDLNKYIYDNLNKVNDKEIEELQDKDIQMNEYVILGLRLIKGFSIKEFESNFKVDFYDRYKEILDKLLGLDLIHIKDDQIALTDKGIDFANIVWEEFV